MTAEDLLAVQNMAKGTDMSSYEHFKVAEMSSRRPSNAAVLGVVLGGVGLVAAAGAWIFVGTYANAKAKGNEALINSNAEHAREIQSILAGQVAANRLSVENAAARQSDFNLSVTQSVSQAGTQTSNTSASSSALAQAEATLLTNALTGQSQLCPTPVTIYSAPQPCGCPVSCN